VSWSLTLATAARVLRQLRGDHRTVAMILLVPVLLLVLVYFMFDGESRRFDPLALIMLGIFPFSIMFLITSIAMLRERTTGTLERLLSTPMAKLDLLLGYGISFGIAAAAQAIVAAAVAYLVLGLDTAGSAAMVLLIAVVTAILGVGLGLLCSAFARTEFQAVQFVPLVVMPQVFLCGLFVPRDEMAGWLEAISTVLPLTYAVEALQDVGAQPNVSASTWIDIGVVFAASVAALALGAGTLRRRTD
jgi:ABC-2 type transport system permease protein